MATLPAAVDAARLPAPPPTAELLHPGVLAVRFNAQGSYCLTCGKNRAITLWNPHRGIAIKSYSGHGYEVLDVAVVTDNSK